MAIMRRDFERIYYHLVDRAPLVLPPLRVQYQEVGFRQHELPRSSRLDRSIAFGRNQWTTFASDRLGLDGLPSGEPRPPIRWAPIRFASHHLAIDRVSSCKIRSPLSQYKITPHILFLSVFVAMMHSYADHSLIQVRIHLANRRRPELRNVVGLLNHCYPMGIPLSGVQMTGDLLHRVRSVLFVLGCAPRFTSMSLFVIYPTHCFLKDGITTRLQSMHEMTSTFTDTPQGQLPRLSQSRVKAGHRLRTKSDGASHRLRRGLIPMV
jgi:hypothetical protein